MGKPAKRQKRFTYLRRAGMGQNRCTAMKPRRRTQLLWCINASPQFTDVAKNATHVNLRLTWFQRAPKRWTEWSRSSSHELKDLQDKLKTGAIRELCMLRTLGEKDDCVCRRETCEILSALLARAHVHAACVPWASVGCQQIFECILLK